MSAAARVHVMLREVAQSVEARNSDDDALMSAVRAGEVQSLALLFDRHHAALFNFFVRTGSPRPLAEDLVQDVFVRILKYRSTYRPGSRFTPWMYLIARNVRLDHLHKRRGEVVWDDAYTPHFEPGDTAQSAQEHRLLARALERLPPEKREILVLSRLQEMKYDDIGALLGCETATVKVRVHRALRELRGHYEALAAEGKP